MRMAVEMMVCESAVNYMVESVCLFVQAIHWYGIIIIVSSSYRHIVLAILLR